VSEGSLTAGGDAGSALLEPLRAESRRAAILTDVDGTLAPIAMRPELARTPPAAREALRSLSERYGLVACISGRRAAEARDLVGVEEIAYAGNHGLELLAPGAAAARVDPRLAGHEGDAAAFLDALDPAVLAEAGLRREEKGPIQALHWRGAPDEAGAEEAAARLGATAEDAGLRLHRGRKVLELRPPVEIGKGAAVSALLAGDGNLALAAYAGDDRTDLDAFRRLRELRDEERLEGCVCVGVASPEGPVEVVAEADVAVDGPEGWLRTLSWLAA
jgi:trehalose-phosphatase